jgi:hypothetical protein
MGASHKLDLQLIATNDDALKHFDDSQAIVRFANFFLSFKSS